MESIYSFAYRYVSIGKYLLFCLHVGIYWKVLIVLCAGRYLMESIESFVYR